MEDFNTHFNIFGEHSNLEEWFVADESPVKKRKRQEGREHSGEVTGRNPPLRSGPDIDIKRRHILSVQLPWHQGRDIEMLSKV